MGLNKSEVLKRLTVGSLIVKVGWNIPSKLQFVSFGVTVKKVLHALELGLLSLSEVVLVGASAVEGQRVVRELRVLLVEDVIIAIIPVRIRGSICT